MDGLHAARMAPSAAKNARARVLVVVKRDQRGVRKADYPLIDKSGGSTRDMSVCEGSQGGDSGCSPRLEEGPPLASSRGRA
jgi:hypothetical protein